MPTAMIRAVKRGVPVRLIVEPSFYRDKSNVWQAYQVDRLYSAGVQIRVRAHQGFTHQKTVLLYGQAMSIIGSSNWTLDSNKAQHEHNYFTTKSWMFSWLKANFTRKWTNSTGNVETDGLHAPGARRPGLRGASQSRRRTAGDRPCSQLEARSLGLEG